MIAAGAAAVTVADVAAAAEIAAAVAVVVVVVDAAAVVAVAADRQLAQSDGASTWERHLYFTPEMVRAGLQCPGAARQAP